MGTKAQLTQNRSRVRRDELLAAAIELFAEGGSRAITHRAVAARAGLPPASTTYYFETIDDLIREALGAHVDKWTADLTKLTQVEFEADVSIDDAAAFVTAIFAARGPEVAALELSIFLAAAQVPELRDNAAEAMRALESLAVAMLERIGITDGASLAASIVALIAGTALRRQSGQYSERSEALLLSSTIRDLVAAHVLSAETIDRTLAELRKAKA
jgi:DNA-binding transcriptional regulator YbjK